MIDNNCNVQLIKALFSLVVLVLDFVVCFGGLVLSEGLLFVGLGGYLFFCCSVSNIFWCFCCFCWFCLVCLSAVLLLASFISVSVASSAQLFAASSWRTIAPCRTMSSDASSNYGNQANSWRFFPEEPRLRAAAADKLAAREAEEARLVAAAADELAAREAEEARLRAAAADELAAREARLSEAAASAARWRLFAEQLRQVFLQAGYMAVADNLESRTIRGEAVPCRPAPPPAIDKGRGKDGASNTPVRGHGASSSRTAPYDVGTI